MIALVPVLAAWQPPCALARARFARPAALAVNVLMDAGKISKLEATLAELDAAGMDQAMLEPLKKELADLKAEFEGLEAPAQPPAGEEEYAGEARLPIEFTNAVPDAGQKRLPLSPEKPDPRARIPGARELPPCTVVVVGANGRVGSKVCTELLRKHSKVSVRALVRSASRFEGYERLSYETGAEDGKMEIRPAWEIQEGGFAQGQTMEFDPAVQGDYGLDRLEIVECEVRHPPDVQRALAGADAVVYCASTFGEGRTKLPDRLDSFNERVAQFGADLFELRLPGFGRRADDVAGRASDEAAAARRASAAGKTADEEGLQLVLDTFGKEYDDTSGLLGSDGGLQENEFGYRKRQGEAAVRRSGLESVIVRAAVLDQLRIEEGLQVRSKAGVVAEEAGGAGAGEADAERDKIMRNNRIHTRDVARVLVGALFGVEGGDAAAGPTAHTFEVWTEEFGKASPSFSAGALFTSDPEAVRQRWREEGREEQEEAEEAK